jgi:hypothetical protein
MRPERFAVRYNLLHLPQGRPCGRPPAALRPGDDTTVTGEPASPSASGYHKTTPSEEGLRWALEALWRTSEALPGLALVLNPARLVLVVELMSWSPTTARAPNPRQCASDPAEHVATSCVPQDATVLLTRRMNKD